MSGISLTGDFLGVIVDYRDYFERRSFARGELFGADDCR